MIGELGLVDSFGLVSGAQKGFSLVEKFQFKRPQRYWIMDWSGGRELH